jgi:hypothetical protein
MQPSSCEPLRAARLSERPNWSYGERSRPAENEDADGFHKILSAIDIEITARHFKCSLA